MRVKCIDARFSELILQEGKIYEVEKDLGNGEYLLVGYHRPVLSGVGGWGKGRFEIVSGELPTATQLIKSSTVKSPTPKSKVDVEEEKCWKAMRPHVAADECCAGACKKALCWIHKDT